MMTKEASKAFLTLCLPYFRGDAGRSLMQMDAFMQHGTTTTLQHCVAVAYVSFLLAKGLRIRFDREALVEGALLHDYFLYDWHDGAKWHKWHGFRHPGFALKNAERDFTLSDKARGVIRTHMFPFVPIPPKSREGLLVSIADKVCTVKEVVKKEPYAKTPEIAVASLVKRAEEPVKEGEDDHAV